jgi:hypothetical protein
MTRWRAQSIASTIEPATVFQVVAELHIVGRPTEIMMGDAFTLAHQQLSVDGVVVTARPGHIVMRLDDGRTLHLRPRQAVDRESGFDRPRGKLSSDWTVERVS